MSFFVRNTPKKELLGGGQLEWNITPQGKSRKLRHQLLKSFFFYKIIPLFQI